MYPTMVATLVHLEPLLTPALIGDTCAWLRPSASELGYVSGLKDINPKNDSITVTASLMW